MAAPLLAAELDAYIAALRRDIPGARAVALADRDGVLLAKAADADLEDDLLERLQVASGASAAEQAGRVGMGAARTLVTFGRSKRAADDGDDALKAEEVLVHVPLLPLLLAVLGDAQLNVGVVLGLRDKIATALEPIRVAAQSVEADA